MHREREKGLLHIRQLAMLITEAPEIGGNIPCYFSGKDTQPREHSIHFLPHTRRRKHAGAGTPGRVVGNPRRAADRVCLANRYVGLACLSAEQRETGACGPTRGAQTAHVDRRGRFRIPLARLAVLLLIVSSTTAYAQTGENILVVANERSPLSLRIAEYYAKKRGVPPSQVLHIRVPVSEEIDRVGYQLLVEAPVATWFGRNAAQDRILYIVLTKDVPLRVAGTGGLDGTGASVDSELTLLYRKMLRTPVPVAGRVPNPYFAQARTLPAINERFTHRRADIYLVTRLDAFSEAEVIRLIDRAAAPASSGKIVLDQRGTGDAGDRWLEQASDALGALGRKGEVLLERTTTVVKNEPNVLGYYSWGSNDPAFKDRRLNLGFVPGSIAATFVSTDGRTFHEPPADWRPGSWDNRASFYAGSSQSLIGDLLREGVTAAAAHVAEPFLDGTIRPQVLFPAYVSGLNVAEAFYSAMPYLSWQTVVIGDPLCAPFRQGALSREDIDKGLDPETELPALFSARRLEADSQRRGAGSRQTAALLLRAESRLARADRTGARAALEQALELTSRRYYFNSMPTILMNLTGWPSFVAGLYCQRLAASTARRS